MAATFKDLINILGKQGATEINMKGVSAKLVVITFSIPTDTGYLNVNISPVINVQSISIKADCANIHSYFRLSELDKVIESYSNPCIS